MRRSFVIIAMSIIAAVLCGCTNTVVYDKQNSLKLTYVAPITQQPQNGYPAIVFIHGARLENIDYPWDSRNIMMRMAYEAAENGYFAVSIDWRQPYENSAMWPSPMDDSLNAIAWLKKDLLYANNWSMPNQFHIDPNRIGVVGFSAGGMIGLNLGFDGHVKAVVSLAGATNMESFYRYHKFYEKEDPNDPNILIFMSISIINYISLLLGDYAREDINMDSIPDYDQDYYNASPVKRAVNNVPLLLIHGVLDNVVPPSQARNLKTRMRNIGGICDLIIYNWGHGENPGLTKVNNLAEPMDINSGVTYTVGDTGMQAMLKFFDFYLK